ncbi:sensor histidine kinase [Metabacillus malikii]|uniref:histidine kinase n=1 Tax=Metabacillus malikii TaxID=1504265 RepID=A0ABT9ZBX9_9BACI|nr:ATP-binding protein [Metabacillus malikii]MDQ0229756.1 sensor histidine kinase regulating citrate/malate metabolism [Metabacillus malikii]
MKKTIEITIGNLGTFKAQTVLNSMDPDVLQEYLLGKVSNPENLQILNEEVRKAEKNTGIQSIYIIQADENGQPRLIVDGSFLEASDRKKGSVSKHSEAFHTMYLQDAPFYTRLEDSTNSVSVLAGVPILSQDGKNIGSLVIEESSETVNRITEEVMSDSLPFFIFSGLFVLFAFSTFFVYQFWLRKEISYQVGETEETYQGEFQSILHTMRSIRHDFINHIQVIQGLLTLKKEERALEYVNSLTSEVVSIELPLKVKNPALFILLQSKWARAQNDKVDMHLFVDDDQFLKIKSIDLIKILSNLIDNAFDATTTLPETERFIRIEIKATSSNYSFTIENIGPTIPKENITKIFKTGFSTKEERLGVPRGDGLSIVRQVVDKYGGTINVQSEKNTTIFQVNIPIKL